MTQALNFRSYGLDSRPHAHEHIQIVLPVYGQLEIEVGGRAGLVDLAHGVFIPPGVKHNQFSGDANRFLIVDCDPSAVDEQNHERLSQQSFFRLPSAAHHLIQFVHLSAQAGEVSSAVVSHSLPLLLHTLGAVGPAHRLSLLLERVGRSLDEEWSVARMAEVMGYSASRLYALFQSELQTSPQQWLSEQRLYRAQYLLAHSQISIADLALQTGYSDQTALTRAMRRVTDMTPAAYRRFHQQ